MEALILELKTELRQQSQKLNEVSEALTGLKAETSTLKMEELRTELREQTEKLNEVSEALKELKAENSVLKMEVLGVGNNLPNGEGVGLIESKTIREVVDSIQFELSEVKALVKGCPLSNKRTGLMASEVHQRLPIGDEKPDLEEAIKDLRLVPIRSKTDEEEMNLMKAKVDELKQRQQPLYPGGTLAGTTIEDISSSIEFSETVKASVVIQFSNYLMSTIKFTGEYYYDENEKPRAKKIRGPTKIIGLSAEAFAFHAGANNANICWILNTLEIEPALSLTLYFGVTIGGNFLLAFGLIPTDLPLNNCRILMQNYACNPETSIKNSGDTKVEVDLVIANEKYFVRARMTPGPKSLVYVDILESLEQSPNQPNRGRKIIYGKSMIGTDILNLMQSEPNGSSPDSVLCFVEIVNGLGVPLKSGSRFIRNCSRHSFMPHEVGPLHCEIFVASDESAVEEIFSYEIGTTDVRLKIAFRAQPSGNCFCAAFVHSSSETTEEELNVSLSPSTWKTLMSRRYANANEGEQIICTRNIRVRASMTNEKRSTLKIFVYTI